MGEQKNKTLLNNNNNNEVDPAIGVTGLFSFITYLIWLFVKKRKDKNRLEENK